MFYRVFDADNLDNLGAGTKKGHELRGKRRSGPELLMAGPAGVGETKLCNVSFP